MEKHTGELAIAVTGVGAIIGQGIVRSLRRSRYAPRVIGIDRSDQSPGPHLVDAFEKKPQAAEDSEAYLDYWAKLVRRHGIQLVMPGLELDMVFLNRHRAFFESLGTRVVLNNPRLIDETADKWRFGEALAATGYPVIPSARPGSWAQAIEALGPAPLLLKPVQGNGSRGIVLLHDEDDFSYWTRKTASEWMLQRIVGSVETEYTVGVFGLGGGDTLGPLIFRRRLAPAGNTLMAEVVPAHALIEQSVATLARSFQPVGPTNLQFRVEADVAYLLEINPRFSSSNSLRTAFGFNEAEMAIDFYLFDRRPAAPVTTAGTGWRYTEDFVIHARDPL
jgi:carbamoyl-phosphate synthase large subunit